MLFGIDVEFFDNVRSSRNVWNESNLYYFKSKHARDEDDSEENNEKSKPKTKKPGHRKKKKNVTFDQWMIHTNRLL